MPGTVMGGKPADWEKVKKYGPKRVSSAWLTGWNTPGTEEDAMAGRDSG